MCLLPKVYGCVLVVEITTFVKVSWRPGNNGPSIFEIVFLRFHSNSCHPRLDTAHGMMVRATWREEYSLFFLLKKCTCCPHLVIVVHHTQGNQCLSKSLDHVAMHVATWVKLSEIRIHKLEIYKSLKYVCMRIKYSKLTRDYRLGQRGFKNRIRKID